VFIKDGIYILIDVFNAPNMGRFTSSILWHPRICYFWCGSNQKNKVITVNTPLINSSL
jgi:hypothetical protein